MEAAALLNDAMSDEYYDLAHFHDHLSKLGFAESAAAGSNAERTLLEAMGESSCRERTAARDIFVMSAYLCAILVNSGRTTTPTA